MKTTVSIRPQDVERQWWLVDADGMTLGRLASAVAMRLQGKHKPCYTPHVDAGDHIVVINCDKIHVTGNKLEGKVYYRHTGYPGGIKERTLQQMLDHKPTSVIEKAVKRMLPKGPLGRDMYRKLHVYAGNDHPHQAQAPVAWDGKDGKNS